MQIQQAGITLPDEEYYRRKDNDKVRVMAFVFREDVVRTNSNWIEWRLSANFTCPTELIWSAN